MWLFGMGPFSALVFCRLGLEAKSQPKPAVKSCSHRVPLTWLLLAHVSGIKFHKLGSLTHCSGSMSSDLVNLLQDNLTFRCDSKCVRYVHTLMPLMNTQINSLCQQLKS